MKNIFNIIKEIFYLLLILVVLGVGNYFYLYKWSLSPIYNYYFKFKENKATILKYESRKSRPKGIARPYYYIRYTIKDNPLPQYKWVVIYNIKGLKEGDVINFKYNPDNPEEMIFTLLKEFFFLGVSIIFNVVFAIFLLERCIKIKEGLK